MRIHVVHCPNRGEHVCVTWMDVAADDWDEAPPSERDILCLNAGPRCVDPFCDLFGQASVRMRERLQRFQERRAERT